MTVDKVGLTNFGRVRQPITDEQGDEFSSLRRRRFDLISNDQDLDQDAVVHRRRELASTLTYDPSGKINQEPNEEPKVEQKPKDQDVPVKSDDFDQKKKGIFADFDGDSKVSGTDLGLLLGKFGSDDAAFDLDQNGAVDGSDLKLLVEAFNRGLQSEENKK